MSDVIKLNNDVSTIDINRMIKILGTSYSTLINNDSDLSLFPSVMLWGPVGVGKSQAVRQIGEVIEKNTGKKVVVTDVRLLLFNPIDLRGIPTSNADKTLAIWLKPQIFNMDESKDVVNILLLDEISAAPQSVQAAAYQITLDRKIGEHILPKNCIVIAAGNRVTDKSVAYKMPKALANRLMHFEVENNVKSWKSWAINHNIHPFVMGFINFKPTYLNRFNAKDDYLSFATPRSWEMVSNILNNVNSDIDAIYPLIQGLVGGGVAMEFRTYVKVYNDLPSIEDIFNGKKVKVPTNLATIYALCSAMVDYTRNHQNDLRGIANSVTYATNFPRDFQTLLIQDYLLINNFYTNNIASLPEIREWMRNNGGAINGSFGA